jgi:FAD/FMN-containing dehydrogenase
MPKMSPGGIAKLKRDLRGSVLLPGHLDYSEAVLIDNGRINARPAMIVKPADADDIARSIEFAREFAIPFSVRGGGHSAAGYCMNTGGLVLDMSGMSSLYFDGDATLHAEGGVLWNDAYSYLGASGSTLIPVGGGCPGVGMTGFLLGGGFSFVSRSYGLSADQLLNIELVMADGNVRRVGRDSTDPDDRDLFWACRGGGGGNFGVVTGMDVQLQAPRTQKMLAGQIGFPLATGRTLIPFYNEWVDSLPNEMAVYGFLGIKNSVPAVFLTPVFNGEFSEGLKLLQPLFDFDPFSVQLERFTLPEWEAFNNNFTAVNQRKVYIRSGTFRADALNADLVSLFERFIQNAPSDDSFIIWTHAGGQISQVGPSDTAFVHRDTRFVYEIKSIWETPADAEKNIRWAYEFGSALDPYVTGAYVNYIDPLLKDWPQKYYGDNYARLTQVKQKVDPNGFFRFKQSIGSTYQPPGDLALPPC